MCLIYLFHCHYQKECSIYNKYLYTLYVYIHFNASMISNCSNKIFHSFNNDNTAIETSNHFSIQLENDLIVNELKEC